MDRKIENIRNFSIIAHIDHGKSTLSDRLIEICGGLESREMKEQVLDSIDIERERGITIKSQAVRLNYKSKDGNEYILNLMDTPGHVDFGYEVSRCLAACEGSILLVDATQGVEAQTLANTYKAIDVNNEILPVLSKADLPSAEPEKTKQQIEDIIGIDASDALFVSGKTGEGVSELLEMIVKKIPAPISTSEKLKAMLVDAWYDNYLGVVLLIRIIDGSIKIGDKIKMLQTDSTKTIDSIGVFTPKKKPVDSLSAGEVGYICANIKNVHECKIGDTIVAHDDKETKPLAGFKKVSQVVFCGLYPVNTDDYQKLKDSLEKFALNDSSITFENETSTALGLGFRCGFLGLLHMEVVYERLCDEYDLDLITTFPSVVYRVYLQNGEMKEIHNAADMPDPVYIEKIEEPIATVDILTTNEYVGDIISLCLEKRGIQKGLTFSGETRAVLQYEIPVGEIIFDFHDRLKSISKGYASSEWSISKYEESDVVKVNILLNNEQVDALSILTHRSKSEFRGRKLCAKLKDLIPRHMFAIPVQAAIGGKIIARETIKPFRKDVTAKLYGGDVTRRMKLLEKQKKGKKRMKSFGSVNIPQEVFIKALKD